MGSPDIGGIVFEVEPKGEYEDFINKVTTKFLYNFRHGINYKESKVNKVKSWVITENRLKRLRNILIQTIENEIEKEDMRSLNKEYNNTISELKNLILKAKEDLNYIEAAVKLKVDEEIKYG